MNPDEKQPQPKFLGFSITPIDTQKNLIKRFKNSTQCALASVEFYVARVSISRALGLYQGIPPADLSWDKEDIESCQQVFRFVQGLPLEEAIAQTLLYLNALHNARKDAESSLNAITSKTLGECQ